MNSLKQQVLELLSALIRIPSINPNLTDEKDQNEMNIAVYARDWLQKHHIKAVIEEVQPGRPNVYAEVGEDQGKTLCFCAHLDTVGVKEMTIPPFEPVVEGNKVYGRGSCDMKGGLAAVMCAARAFAEAKLPGKLILALVCDEEYTSIGADDFVRRHRADACILTEPSDLNLLIAHKGFLWGKIATQGKSAHGSRWDIGESAINKMGKILTALDTFDKTILRKRVKDLVGPASLHVSLIEGGSGISTYASSCTIHLERRTLPTEQREEVQAELDEVIRTVDPEASIEWYFYREPFACDAKEEIVECVNNSFRNVLGLDPKHIGWGIWTDAAIFQKAGIPTVNIGPIGFGLHEPVEWVDIDSVVHNASILFHAAKEYLNAANILRR